MFLRITLKKALKMFTLTSFKAFHSMYTLHIRNVAVTLLSRGSWPIRMTTGLLPHSGGLQMNAFLWLPA